MLRACAALAIVVACAVPAAAQSVTASGNVTPAAPPPGSPSWNVGGDLVVGVGTGDLRTVVRGLTVAGARSPAPSIVSPCCRAEAGDVAFLPEG